MLLVSNLYKRELFTSIKLLNLEVCSSSIFNTGHPGSLTAAAGALFTRETTQSVALAELANVYHCVKHNGSYNSLDCGLKLCINLFQDSSTAKKISCGRTKSEAIVTDVLASHAEEEVVKELLQCEKDAGNFFSVATDTSNKGNRKMYPVCVHYFTAEKGRQSKPLNFIEETSAIAGCIEKTLTKHGLGLKQISAFCADNTNANFGKKNSAYMLLKEKNSRLFKSGCLAHIVNNTFKHAIEKLDVDIESTILKVFSHFSSSSLRREELKEFVSFVDLEWLELVKHVPTRWFPTRWLSIDRIVKFYPEIISYFISLGKDCPKAISKLFIGR